LYKQFGHFNFLLIVLSVFFSGLSASSFKDFKRTQAESLQIYMDDKDKKFDNYLQSNWEGYTSIKPKSLYDEEKPNNHKPAKNRPLKSIGPKIDIYVNSKQNKIKENKKIKNKSNQVDGLVFDFFGTRVDVITPDRINRAKFSPQSQLGIKNFLDSVIVSDYQPLIDNISKISTELNLNDWGKYLLIKKISEKIFPSQDNSRLLSGFIFNKLGYSVRLGLVSKHVVLMFNSKNTIYLTPSYQIDNNKFYLISNYAQERVAKVFTYTQDYPESNKKFDLSLNTLPFLEEDIREKSLEFKQYGKKYNIKYKYNQNLIDFMSTYPQADYETYFNAGIEPRSYQDIASALRKYINGKRASEALDFVLHFVQNAFKYEVDSQQFGREKVMFAQETLYYDKSDCEDRAVLFAYLVKELFNISVVGVKYKNHMSTALYVPMDGDSVRVNAKRFVIADPTYINATIGQNMPKYKHKKPNSFIHVETKK